MRKHRDADGIVRSVTITRAEWAARGRQRTRDRGRAYVWVNCQQQGRVRVRAMVVPDGSPEATPGRRARSSR